MHNLHGFVAFMNKVALKLNRRKRFYIQSCSSVSAAYCHVIYLKNFFLNAAEIERIQFCTMHAKHIREFCFIGQKILVVTFSDLSKW